MHKDSRAVQPLFLLFFANLSLTNATYFDHLHNFSLPNPKQMSLFIKIDITTWKENKYHLAQDLPQAAPMKIRPPNNPNHIIPAKSVSNELRSIKKPHQA